VGRERYTFHSLDPIERRLRRLAEDIAYLTVTDRTDRKAEELLGRFELSLSDALPYLEDPFPSPGDELDDDGEPSPFGDDPDEDEPDGEDGDEEAEPDAEPEPGDDESSASRFAEAGCRWLRDIAVRNTVGEPYRRFRVKAYGHKGAKVVDTGSFLCRNDSYDLDLPIGAAEARGEGAALQIPTPSFDEVATMGAAKGLKALGDYYAQWGRIVLGSMGQLQGVNNDMLSKLHHQLQDSRGQVDELVAAILEFRAAEMKLSDERRAEERVGDARTQLAHQALHQLGDAAKAFLTAKGINPEMADVLGSIGQSPELVSTLNDPEVKALMNDPANLKALAGMLKAAAAQSRAARGGSAPPNPDPGEQSAAG